MNSYMPEGSLIRKDKNYEYTSTIEGLEDALEKQVILEAPALLCDHNFNLHIGLGGGIRGIIPRGEIQASRGEGVKDIAILTRVGKPVSFKVLGFERLPSGERIAILSRKAAQEECLENYVSALIAGDVIAAKVTHIENFGAFLDIGCGIVSLLSIDSISVSRISHPYSRLSAGDSVYAVVKGRDERGRLFLSMRELLGAWEENAAAYSEGETVKGIVRSVESYGVFVELTPNLAGLAEYRADTFPGDSAAVYIKSIIPEKMKVKLIIIDTHRAQAERPMIKYFIDPEKTKHIESWTYSPMSSKRVIESVF
jgi:small subunit ribosomal protein S1